jgi:N-methylhydantoinase A
LDPVSFLGGEMKLDVEAARRGTDEQIGTPLGMSVESSARAIIDIAIAKMSLAVRQVSVEKGYDPRDFVLVASGGAGPLHAVAIARELSIPVVVIPWFPSHFSALGMLLADERHDAVRTFPAPLEQLDFASLIAAVAELEKELRTMSRQKGMEIEIFLDLRYVGQEFNLSIPVSRDQFAKQDSIGIRHAFDELHKARYEHNAEHEPVEMINVRLIARAPRPKPSMPKPGGSSMPARRREAIFEAGPAVPCDVYDRDNLAAGTTIQGPALIQEYGSTTVIFPGDRCEVAPSGELVIHLKQRG